MDQSTTETYYRHIQLDLEDIEQVFEGELFTDRPHRIMYATDASAYRELPIAVAYPKHKEDIRELVRFAKKHNSSLIPRTAGTSLAGQVVGSGIIVDVSKHMNRIIEINTEERWIRVEPGVVLDEMNKVLEPYGLFFSPETSTSNRCMVGGMIGNNSCGAHSLIYGSTRDHLISVETILCEGVDAHFGPLTKAQFDAKKELNSFEGSLYRNIDSILSNPKNQEFIRKEFPHPEIHRRNTGYAIDLLLETQAFSETDKPFNFASLVAGSEGTLAIITEAKLHLDPLPPSVKGLICIHCHTLEEAFQGNLEALKFAPGAIELMDKTVMDLSKENITQRKNRFFIDGDPEAILIVEFARDTQEEILRIASEMEKAMRAKGLGYHFPVIFGSDIPRVWNIRKAGLGLLSNMPGDAKPVPVVEDAAVRPEDLPAYIKDFNVLLEAHKLSCVYYAHIATGELHLRPVLNLKDPRDVELFHIVAEETAKLVKKYRGSLSGEHGDGRLRGEFIPLMIGKKNYELIRSVKVAWDPENIFNPGKIIDTPKMNTSLRYEPGQHTAEINTVFDFTSDQGFLRAAERCNGSGDCRKSEIIGGTMCPSYQASRDENTTTRARANMLREIITQSKSENPFASHELYDVLDLCLSCKGCKSECPSNVDMAKLKAEFLQHYYDVHRVPLRTKAIAHISKLNALASRVPAIANFFMSNVLTSGLMKRVLKFAPKRSLPLLYKTTLRSWLKANADKLAVDAAKGSVYLFVDEFSEYNDTLVGIKAVQLLTRLGYEVKVTGHEISGRTYISKGLLRKAKVFANKNVEIFKELINENTPLLGIEPSAILTFRDEYPDLVDQHLRDDAKKLARNALMIDEFLAAEIEKGNITSELFTSDHKAIKLHGHCQQKAVASTNPTKTILTLPKNYSVEEIPSGCCGMAGSFGYEKEHYELSMKVGELVLFPEVRKTDETTIVAAPGTSCRHQIKDGTDKKALHPIEILFDALK
ncbi:MAG TPA: FAD-linked oxidase C-terminal domain-containing protein [Bacteroidales bacterium]|mgnify:CR=1 FL=1|nr:FAD-linked oxidase C-terminal domain-containing protein [Bacteroidales bacterium]HRX97173.1 FAD-linked oxidase C-terminal domain-containing protein [Bacteroidales bacterium]